MRVEYRQSENWVHSFLSQQQLATRDAKQAIVFSALSQKALHFDDYPSFAFDLLLDDPPNNV